MTPAELQAWIQVSGILINSGIATVNQIRTLIKGFRRDLSEDQMDAIVQGVIDDAKTRKAKAEAEVALLEKSNP